MARVTRREWYERTNAAWPDQVPTLTAEEAVSAAKRLYRFVAKKTWTGAVVVTSGRRRTSVRPRRIIVNPGQGWREFVHELSHWIPWYVHHYSDGRLDAENAHTAAHARLERRMVREVVRRGWLAGKLKPAAKPEKPKPDAAAVRHQRTLDAVARWEAKERRAVNALKKLRRRLAYYERRAAS